MPDYAIIASPISKLARKLQAKEHGPLTNKELIAQKRLKKKLISPLVLTLPKNKGQCTSVTNAFDGQAGCAESRR